VKLPITAAVCVQLEIFSSSKPDRSLPLLPSGEGTRQWTASGLRPRISASLSEEMGAEWRNQRSRERVQQLKETVKVMLSSFEKKTIFFNVRTVSEAA